MKDLYLPNKFTKSRDLQKILRMELLPKAKPPKFDKKYEGTPLEKGQAVCIICKHSFSMREGTFANNDTCGAYWCRVEYLKSTPIEIEEKMRTTEKEQEEVGNAWECPHCGISWGRQTFCEFCNKGGEN